MAEPDWNPDTGGRSLAEILREAGIESANRKNRRRWDDPAEAGLRQRRAEAAAAEGAATRAGYGRRRSDLAESESASFRDEPRSFLEEPRPARDEPRSFRDEQRPVRDEPRQVRDEPRSVRDDGMPPVERQQKPRRAPDPSTSAIPGLRPDRKPGVPAGRAMPSAPVPSMPSAPVPSGPRHSGPVPSLPSGATSARGKDGAPARKQRAAEERRPKERRPEERFPQRSPSRAAPQDEHFSTGPIPVVRPEDLDDELDASPKESALAWLRFAGELVIALAAGIGIYFAATLLWENVPYLAVLLVPLAVTGLVAGVGAWRQRQGHEPVGPRLLAILVVAGTLLTIAPAAGLLAAT
jgi:hypothetical protein